MADTIHPHELPGALTGHDQAAILSLDCFDTLLWRDCHAPVGVFAALPHVTEGQRVIAEERARKAARYSRQSNEVTIEEIYAHLMPNAGDAARTNAVAAELSAEAAHCYAFAPTVALMRAAKARDMQVVIVSDTYLNEAQLRELIERSAGADVAAMIDRMFCSATYGQSKAGGLFAPVLRALKCAPAEILHIGDNLGADFDGARALGIPALHLVQFEEAAKQRLRFEQSCASIIGIAQDALAAPQPHRAVLAEGEPQLDDPAKALGFNTLGPVFHSFDRWLEQEAKALTEEHGGTVHWLFLMRDGHLPKSVHALRGTSDSAAPIELSRFVATAASLTSNEAIDLLTGQEHDLNPSTLARQMLFEEAEITKIVDEDAPEQSSKRVNAELKTGQRKKLIRRRAQGHADRLIAHIRSAVDPQQGDTLMLVDLGYNGSAQNRVDALLRDTFDCHVAGRYLLLREMDAPGLDKLGMIDAANFDTRLLEAMCGNVAVLEQLSTVAMGSTIGFTDTGEPIRKDSGVKGRQSEVREAVQQGVLAFCDATNRGVMIRAQHTDAVSHWRDAACAALLRMMFLPTQDELAVVSSFEHDINLGSERMVRLFDVATAQEGLRRRGLFYMKGSERMYLPAELAEEDMATRLSLLSQKRFGLTLTYQDHVAQTLDLPVFHIDGPRSSAGTVSARPTHDGCWVAAVPIGASKYSVAVQFGEACDWVELSSVTASPVASLAGSSGNDDPPIPLPAVFDGMEQHAGTLFRCTEKTGMALVHPPQTNSDDDLIVEFVFRPIAGDEITTENSQLSTQTGVAA